MSIVKDIDEVIEIIAQESVDTILEVVDILIPDGKPYGYVDGNEMEVYLKLRGNPEAWTKWIAEQAAEIVNKLSQSGLDPDQINSVHPMDIAQKFALSFSVTMEEEINGISTGGGAMETTGSKVLSAGIGG